MMQAGTYYVGDLCYVLHDAWDEVCNLIIKDNRRNDGEFELADGRKFACYSTAYGDGTYEDAMGREYWVDSGTIGCMLFEDLKLNIADNNFHPEGSHMIDFERDFNTSNLDAVIKFGSVHIDTDPEIEEDDEY